MPANRISDAINAIGFGPAQVYVELLAHGVWFADGMVTTMIALTSSTQTGMGITKEMRATLTSIVFLGIAIGCGLSGYLGDKIGRRYTIICCYASVAIFGAASALCWGFASLAIARLFLGVSMGLGMPTSLALVSEMSPVEWRVPLMGMRGVVFSCGNIMAVAIIIADDPDLSLLHWRSDILLAVVPPLILGIFAFAFLPESPVFLEANGRHTDAQKVLAWIMHHNGVEQSDNALEVKSSPIMVSDGRKSWSTQIRTVFSRHLAYSTCVLLMCSFSINFVEYGSVYAEPQVLQHTHAKLGAGWQLLCKNIVNLAVRCLVIFPAALSSRKAALIAALIGGIFVGDLLFAWTGSMETRTPLLAVLYYGGFYLPLLGVALALLVTFQLSVEIYPTSAAATGSAFIVGFGRFGSIAAPFVFEFLEDHWQSFYYTMAVLCGATALFATGLQELEHIATAAKDGAMEPAFSKKGTDVL